MGLPNINVIFKKLANNAVTRSARGIVGLIIRDDTNKTFSIKEYQTLDDLTEQEEALYTADNLQLIKDCFVGAPNKVIVIRIDATDGAIADALNIVKGLKVNWIGCDGIKADQDAICTFIKAQEALKKTFKAVVFNPTTSPDSKQIVVLDNANITFTDSRGQKAGEQYIPTLLGIFAGLSLSMSSTYFVCSNLTSVIEPTDVNADIDAGKLVLINDDGVVKIGRGVTSLTTITTNNTVDMKKITVVEAANLMMDDIRDTFKDNYVGKYKNKYDNQVILLSAINAYFRTLENDDVLDNEYNNIASIDIESQRTALIEAGKSDATNWTDVQIKNNTVGSNVYLAANVKILDAIEDLNFVINLD